MRRILNNASLILNLSSEEQVLLPRVVDLSALCTSLTEFAAQMTPQLHFTIRCGQGILAEVDPRLILQLLTNLLSNAILHAEGCSRISVSLLESAGSVVLAVDDDGSGILPEELPRVFDRYRHGFRPCCWRAGPGRAPRCGSLCSGPRTWLCMRRNPCRSRDWRNCSRGLRTACP